MSSGDSELDTESTQYGGTRIVTHTLELEGIEFSWWAVSESPALVTVSSEWLGRRSEFTSLDREAMAKELAKMLLEDQREQAELVRAQLQRTS